MNAQTAATRFLDREPPADYRREWTERVAAKTADVEHETQTAFIFRAGAEWLGLPARVLHEVGERAAIHSLPHRRGGALTGLTSVRGELLLCASLETLLGLENTADHDRSAGRMLVASHRGERVAFPVNEIHGLHRYEPRELRAVPATLTKAASFMLGVLPWRGRSVGFIDDELLFHALAGELS